MNQSSKRRYMLAQNHTGLTVFLNKSFTPKEESFKFYLEIADEILSSLEVTVEKMTKVIHSEGN